MKIMFLARPSYDRYSVSIYKNIKEKHNKDIEGVFITSDIEESDYINKNVPEGVVYETSQYLRKHWDEFTEDKLLFYEEKYDCKPIWSYILTDRFLIGKEYDYVVKITVGLFSFFENIYEYHKIDFYYSEAIATLQCYIAYLVGKKNGTIYLTQTQVRGSKDSEYHYFIYEPYQYDLNFPSNYKDIEFTQKEKREAELYLKDFEEKYTLPPGQLRLRTKPKFKFKFFFLPLKQIIKRFDKKYTDKFSYMYYKEYEHITDPIRFFFRYKKAKKYYNKADFSKKYVYFPLHYQPEASTLVCAPKYENQIVFIDALAKSLPADTVFYIKEHYALLGNRNLNFYNELKKYPNIVLIDPWESSRELIENAECVVTLTGTAGYEAMLLRKPVILGGHTFFEMTPGVVYVEDIFQNYVPVIQQWKMPSREEVIQYLCASFMGYRKGNTYAQSYYHMIDDNIDDIANSLYNQMLVYKN